MAPALIALAFVLGAWGMIRAHNKGREDLLVFYAAITASALTLAVLP